MYIKLNTTLDDVDTIVKTFVTNTKRHTRQSDMIVRFDDKEFVILYLVDESEHAKFFYNKMLSLVAENQLISSHSAQIKISASVQKPREWVLDAIARAKNPSTDEY